MQCSDTVARRVVRVCEGRSPTTDRAPFVFIDGSNVKAFGPTSLVHTSRREAPFRQQAPSNYDVFGIVAGSWAEPDASAGPTEWQQARSLKPPDDRVSMRGDVLSYAERYVSDVGQAHLVPKTTATVGIASNRSSSTAGIGRPYR